MILDDNYFSICKQYDKNDDVGFPGVNPTYRDFDFSQYLKKDTLVN
jgi:hypothetical protein